VVKLETVGRQAWEAWGDLTKNGGGDGDGASGGSENACMANDLGDFWSGGENEEARGMTWLVVDQRISVFCGDNE
jgi:hypothetical protein